RRSNDYSQYRGATLLVLNRMETAQAAGESSTDGASVRKAGQRLVRSLALGALVVTMDKDGALLIEQGRSARVVPTRARVIFDNAGAGDMFIAALAPVLSSGRSLLESVRLANVAAGLEVEKFGAQTVSLQEIVRDILEESHHAGSKQRDLGTLLEDVARHRMLGQTVVFTNGCFDLIHQGHIQLLNFAGAQGDVLIVGLNSDRSVRMNKGPGRPYCSAKERGRVLAGLEAVDYVVIFDTKRPIKLIKALQPDILVKGGDYNLKGVVGHDVVESYGGRVVLAPLVKNLSTTDLVQRIQANGNGPRSRKATKKTRATKRRAAK
ncbi:MAG: D-glycero-beta-D-manno-heptose 1-phosphate adenylyltransferase, partial [Planctomycetia bacterium]|nr:D-glycero-beta-D-manno-heptose 1-phosphate adenylyltransferase [Planctomycetia bacterium]